MSACTTATNYRPCTREAAGLLNAGCVHEHIADNPACAEHAQFWRTELAARRVFCQPCTTSRKPHDCLLREIAWRPLVTAP
jgi:hypothetical protein